MHNRNSPVDRSILIGAAVGGIACLSLSFINYMFTLYIKHPDMSGAVVSPPWMLILSFVIGAVSGALLGGSNHVVNQIIDHMKPRLKPRGNANDEV